VKVEWSPLADEQVDDAIAYISEDNPTAALHWLERLIDRTKSLATFPDSGRVVPELGRQDTYVWRAQSALGAQVTQSALGQSAGAFYWRGAGSKRHTGIPSGSRIMPQKPIPGISVLPMTTVAPPAAAFASLASTSSTPK
jgi:plasmid stabilization system protein ParE